MCVVKYSIGYDSNRSLSDERNGKFYERINYFVRLIPNQLKLKLVFP